MIPWPIEYDVHDRVSVEWIGRFVSWAEEQPPLELRLLVDLMVGVLAQRACQASPLRRVGR